MRTKAILALAVILLSGPLALDAAAQAGPGLSATTCGPFVEGSGMTGDFILGVSYFGAIGIQNQSRLRGDLDDFKERGLNSARVWANWTHWGAQNSSVFDGDGGLLGGALSRLIFLIEEAADRNVIVDLTFSWRSFKLEQCTGGNCFEKYKDSMAAAAEALVPYRNVFFDLANEHNAGITGLTLNQVRQIEAAVHAEDPGRAVTVSATGSINTQGSKFNALLNDGTIDFACPHFMRSEDWAEQTGARLKALREAITGSWPIHLQEEARRGATCGADMMTSCCGGSESNCTLMDFLTSLGLSAQDGAAGWNLHTDAGFRLDQGGGSFWSRLDPVEKDVLDAMTGVLGELRCRPGPLYADDFDDAEDDVALQGRALQIGSVIWNTVEPAWRLETKHQRVTTANPNGTATGGIPFHLPTDFEGVASVEAKLTLGPATSVSVGFASSPEDSLINEGVFWVSLADGDTYVYGPGGAVLGHIHPLVAVTEATLRLEYDGGLGELRLYAPSRGLGGGWGLTLTIPVDQEAIDYAVLEIDHGINDQSAVDDFATHLTP